MLIDFKEINNKPSMLNGIEIARDIVNDVKRKNITSGGVISSPTTAL